MYSSDRMLLRFGEGIFADEVAAIFAALALTGDPLDGVLLKPRGLSKVRTIRLSSAAVVHKATTDRVSPHLNESRHQQTRLNLALEGYYSKPEGRLRGEDGNSGSVLLN